MGKHEAVCFAGGVSTHCLRPSQAPLRIQTFNPGGTQPMPAGIQEVPMGAGKVILLSGLPPHRSLRSTWLMCPFLGAILSTVIYSDYTTFSF